MAPSSLRDRPPGPLCSRPDPPPNRVMPPRQIPREVLRLGPLRCPRGCLRLLLLRYVSPSPPGVYPVRARVVEGQGSDIKCHCGSPDPDGCSIEEAECQAKPGAHATAIQGSVAGRIRAHAGPSPGGVRRAAKPGFCDPLLCGQAPTSLPTQIPTNIISNVRCLHA